MRNLALVDLRMSPRSCRPPAWLSWTASPMHCQGRLWLRLAAQAAASARMLSPTQPSASGHPTRETWWSCTSSPFSQGASQRTQWPLSLHVCICIYIYIWWRVSILSTFTPLEGQYFVHLCPLSSVCVFIRKPFIPPCLLRSRHGFES